MFSWLGSTYTATCAPLIVLGLRVFSYLDDDYIVMFTPLSLLVYVVCCYLGRDYTGMFELLRLLGLMRFSVILNLCENLISVRFLVRVSEGRGVYQYVKG